MEVEVFSSFALQVWSRTPSGSPGQRRTSWNTSPLTRTESTLFLWMSLTTSTSMYQKLFTTSATNSTPNHVTEPLWNITKIQGASALPHSSSSSVTGLVQLEAKHVSSFGILPFKQNTVWKWSFNDGSECVFSDFGLQSHGLVLVWEKTHAYSFSIDCFSYRLFIFYMLNTIIWKST